MSAFTRAEIPDMSSVPEQAHWLNNYVLNAMLRGDFGEVIRPFVFNFLRRTVAAFREYDLARERANHYLSNPGNASAYIESVGYWETFAAQAWQACLLLVRPLGQTKTLFRKGDGSAYENLHAVYSTAKHAEGVIARGQMPPAATMPIWLANDGVRTLNHTLTFGQATAILRDLAEWADVLQDPITTREKLRQVAEGAGAGSDS